MSERTDTNDCTLLVPQAKPLDVYVEHRAVWALLAPYLQPKSRFLYHWADVSRGSILRVRSRTPILNATRSNFSYKGSIVVRMLAARRQNTRYMELSDPEVADWFRALCSRSGLEVARISTEPCEMRIGLKGDHRIALPTREIRADYKVTDMESAVRAFADGLGRARRFGCGMILPSLIDGRDAQGN